MKVKRLVSLLLAVLLLVGMVPLNALAALTGGTGVASEDVTNFKLMLSKSFGTTYTTEEGADEEIEVGAADAPYIVESAGDYGLSSVIDNGTVKSTASDANEAGGKAALEKVDRLFKEGVTTSLTGANAVGKGETFYLGIKGEFLPKASNTWKGVFKYQAIVKYDATKFEVVSNSPTVGTENGANYRAAIITNPIGVGTINSNLGYTGKGASKAMTYPDTAMKYFGNYKLGTSATLQADSTDSKINYLVIVAEGTDNKHYLPSGSTWDFVIPMKAKDNATTGTATFEVVANAMGTPSEVIGSTQVYDAKSLLSESSVKKSYNTGDATGLTHITSNDVTVEVTSTEPGASIPASSSIKDVAGQKLDVTLKNCTFTSGAAAGGASTFEVWTTAATPAKVNDAVTASAAKGSDNKVATVTIDGSKLTAGTNYKIVVKNGKFTPATDPAGDLTTDAFSVTAAPKPLTASFNYGTNELSVTENVAWAWKLKSEAATAYHNVNAGAKATLTEADLAKIRTAMGNNNTLADAIQVIAQSDTEKEAVQNVSITKEATPTAATAASALTLDYSKTPPTIQAQSGYEVCSTGTTYVTTEVTTALGGNVKYRKSKTASSIASADATYKMGTATTLSGITNTTTRDKKLLGQTTVGGVQATDMIKVGNGIASAAGGTTKDVAAEEGVTITVTRPGTKGAAGTAVAPGSGTTTGVGFQKPTTLTATKPSSTTADLKLAIPSGKGKFNGTTVVAIKDGTTPVTAGTATLSDGTGTEKGDDVITIAAPTGGWTEDKEYTVEVETTGTTPNLSAKFTTTFTVASAAGYTLKPSITDVTLSKDTFAAGESGTVTVTLGSSHDGKEIKTITGTGVSNADVKAGTFTYTAPSSVPAQQTDVTITITLGDIKYDALTYEETSVGHGSAISVAPKTKDARITDLKLVSVDPADKQGEFAVAADGTITVATPDNLTPNTTYTVTVGSTSIATYTGTATIKVGKAGATVTVANKFYDGTNAVPADKITVTADKGGATLDITITGATYDNANVGSGKAVSITGATISGADAANYTVNTSGITGEIEQLTGAQVKAETTTAAQVGSIADIVAAVKKQTVTIDGVTADLGTVADIVNDADGDGSNDDEIEGAVKAALNASGSAAVIAPGDQIEANVVEADASKASAAPIAVEQYAGGKITLTGIPEGATAAIKSGNATLTDGVLTGLTSETVVVTVTPETGDPYDVEIAVTAKADPTENVYDFTKLDATTLNITVSNLTGDITTNTDATEITVTLPITKKSSSSGGGYVPSTGYTVAIENTGYGSVDTTAITTDEDGKIVSLPTVTNVKKGVSFVGWSTNGQISGVIDPNTFRVQNDELTLTAVYQGYMAGYEDSTARPNKQITRAELLKMLIVATGDYDATKNYGTSTFTDVKNAWYVNYIACAQQSGKDIIAGYGDGTFKPNAPVTRNEAARMICQAFGVTVSEGDTTNKVNDFSKVAGWAQKYVAALCNNGTIHGYEDGEFKGDRAVTRGESAVMINGYLGLTDAAKEQLRNDPALKNIFKDMTDKQAWNFIDVLFAAMCAPASYYSDEITMPQA